MITLHEKFDVGRPRYQAFAYVLDFRTAAEWDPRVKTAHKLSAGPIAVGSRFELVCKLPLGSVTVTYTLMRCEIDETLELRGICPLFAVVDVIHFTDSATGTHVDYRATFELRGPLSALGPAIQSGLERMGRATAAGLAEALADDYPPPRASAATRRADRWVLPGLALFTRAGYHRGQRRWKPMSTWVGDKHVVLTGANSGLGLAAAQRLAELGATLTLVIRDETKAAALLDQLRRDTDNHNIHIELADLSSLEEVAKLAQRLLGRGLAIDALINNAGALFNEYAESQDGIERTFALLLLSPYLLTTRLKPLLLAAPAARVVNVVSGGMYTQQLDLTRLVAGEENYSGSVAYARAKRGLMVLTEQWAEAWADTGIVINATHPGWADTPGVASSLPGFHKLTQKVLRNPWQGADTMVWLAVAAQAGQTSGKLFLDREPRTTHLLSKTIADDADRASLQDLLDTFIIERSWDTEFAGDGSSAIATP